MGAVRICVSLAEIAIQLFYKGVQSASHVKKFETILFPNWLYDKLLITYFFFFIFSEGN